MPLISISIVSHLQGAMVAELLADIEQFCAGVSLEVILTLNLPEDLPVPMLGYQFSLIVIRNLTPLGFGENHNQAFARASGKYFCVLNPDIRIQANVFTPLIKAGVKLGRFGAIAPRVLNAEGKTEDSARSFPILSEIIGKVFGKDSRRSPLGVDQVLYPDWVAGMFMLFPATVFREVKGFDERYFLYYEDVDLCARLKLRNYPVVLCMDVAVIHHARRSSHRNLKYLRWHFASIVRFFLSRPYREIRCLSGKK
jgi:GT2 family glycosyltransferase